MCLRWIFLLIFLATPAVHAGWYQDGQNKMGTRVFVKIWHEDERQANDLLSVSMGEIDRIESVMSTYRTDSQISLVNANAAHGWVPVDNELFALIEQSVFLSEQTGGAFDITFDSIGQFYDFKQSARPSAEQIEAGLSAVDYRFIELNPDTTSVRFTHPATRINLGGIAKGYAIESVVNLLRNAGVKRALVNAGGDTRVLGDSEGGPWRVGIRDPDDEMSLVARFGITDEAISTSGDYEQFFIEEGVRYHHIINPSTGAPAAALRSVTVIGPDATLTDGLSTSVFVMGVEAGLALLDSIPEYSGVVIDADRLVYFSRGFDREDRSSMISRR